MRKRTWIIFFTIIVVLLLYMFVMRDVIYYKAANEANQNLEADGIKLMMPIEDVRNIFGKEEVFQQGFGGNFFEYPSKGISFSVSTDSDYDLFNKICDLRISKSEHSLFGIRIGTSDDEASEILRSWGYKESISQYGEKSYTKGCVYIDFPYSDNKIHGLRIIVRYKNFDPNRVY